MNEESPQTARKRPSILGLALDLLIDGQGWSARELAKSAGVAPSTISAYIWEGALTRERLEELAGFMGLGQVEVERAVVAARLALPPLPVPWSPVDPTPGEQRIVDKAAALAAGEMGDLVLDIRLREIRSENRRRDLDEGRRLMRELLADSPADQRLLLEAAPEYQHWGLAYVLCTESEAAAPNNPHRSLELAELALLVARHVALDVPGSAGFRSRLEAWCTGFVANARRVIGADLPAAERDWTEAWQLWKAGEDPAGLLSKAYLLDMEASLRRDQRNFSLALELHEDALGLARPKEKGIILLNQAATLKDSGAPEDALRSMEHAAQVIDGDRQPRLRWVLRFNQASSLCLLERAAEALPIIEEVRELAERLRNEIDLIKTVWLEANCAAQLGQREESINKMNRVLHVIKERPFDFALASLDLAILYRQEGRFAEIKVLADQMLAVFRAQQVHLEATAAVILFQESAETEQISVKLVRRLQDYLMKARSNQRLRFGCEL